MPNSRKCYVSQGSKAIVLSIKPKYANLILLGKKTVEFRRAWAAHEVSTIAIYASSPVCGLVGVVSVSEIIRAKPKLLWTYCSKQGGALSKGELSGYFEGKETGIAVLLEGVRRFSQTIDPRRIINGFSPPQSFRYLADSELMKLEQAARSLEVGG